MFIRKEIVRKRNRIDKLFHVLDHLGNIMERGLVHESEYYGRSTVNKK